MVKLSVLTCWIQVFNFFSIVAKFEGQLTETYEETIKRFRNDKIEYEGTYCD
jgi:hypothetical protein